MVALKGSMTMMQAALESTTEYTSRLIWFLSSAGFNTTRSWWQGSDRLPFKRALTWMGKLSIVTRLLFSNSRDTLSRVSFSSPGWGSYPEGGMEGATGVGVGNVSMGGSRLHPTSERMSKLIERGRVFSFIKLSFTDL